MAVIVDLELSAQEFELGRILHVEGESSVTLETIVPLGERSVPFFRVFGGRNGFEEAARSHTAVIDLDVVKSHNGEVLYALDWNFSRDKFFKGLARNEANLLEARGGANVWRFELRFPSHESLSEFQRFCTQNEIPIEVRALYNPTKPEVGPWYGLSPKQRETLKWAVEKGFYSIPRGASTDDIAEHFDISDTAVLERLRRGVVNLVTHTLLVSETQETAIQ